MFPIKYIDNNLVWNKDNEVFAYYELIPYNYSFLSAEQKFIVHDSFRQLIAQSREGKIHALQIATESSIRSPAYPSFTTRAKMALSSDPVSSGAMARASRSTRRASFSMSLIRYRLNAFWLLLSLAPARLNWCASYFKPIYSPPAQDAQGGHVVPIADVRLRPSASVPPAQERRRVEQRLQVEQ